MAAGNREELSAVSGVVWGHAREPIPPTKRYPGEGRGPGERTEVTKRLRLHSLVSLLGPGLRRGRIRLRQGG